MWARGQGQRLGGQWGHRGPAAGLEAETAGARQGWEDRAGDQGLWGSSEQAAGPGELVKSGWSGLRG